MGQRVRAVGFKCRTTANLQDARLILKQLFGASQEKEQFRCFYLHKVRRKRAAISASLHLLNHATLLLSAFLPPSSAQLVSFPRGSTDPALK